MFMYITKNLKQKNVFIRNIIVLSLVYFVLTTSLIIFGIIEGSTALLVLGIMFFLGFLVPYYSNFIKDTNELLLVDIKRIDKMSWKKYIPLTLGILGTTILVAIIWSIISNILSKIFLPDVESVYDLLEGIGYILMGYVDITDVITSLMIFLLVSNYIYVVLENAVILGYTKSLVKGEIETKDAIINAFSSFKNDFKLLALSGLSIMIVNVVVFIFVILLIILFNSLFMIGEPIGNIAFILLLAFFVYLSVFYNATRIQYLGSEYAKTINLDDLDKIEIENNDNPDESLATSLNVAVRNLASKTKDKAGEAKEAADGMDEETKAKAKKKSILITILIVIVIAIIFVVKFIFDNFLGFTDIDPTKYLYINYNTNETSSEVYVRNTLNSYSENGYYDDAISSIANAQDDYMDDYYYDNDEEKPDTVNIYTAEEAEALMPKDLTQEQIYFLETCSLDRSTNTEMVNGDTLEVKVSCSEESAKAFKINVVNDTITFEINKLLDEINTDDLTLDVLSDLAISNDELIEGVDDGLESRSNYKITSTDDLGYFYNSYEGEVCHYVEFEYSYSYTTSSKTRSRTGNSDSSKCTDVFKRDGTINLLNVEFLDGYSSYDPSNNSNYVKLDI